MFHHSHDRRLSNTAVKQLPFALLFTLAIFVALVLTGCTKTSRPAEYSLTLTVQGVTNPSGPDTSLPHIASNNEHLIMSWTARQPSDQSEVPQATLRYSEYRGTNWNTPIDVASGSNWFINWADFPAVSVANDGSYLAHWLVRSGESTYAYDVVTAQSVDGKNWHAPLRPHHDNSQTEHGFASHFNFQGKPALVWLDGRYTAAQKDTSIENSSHSDHAGGPMTLRMNHALPDNAVFAASVELDNRVCDCCQTTAVDTPNGPVIFYRDRSDKDIRDIAYVRWYKGQWSDPAILHEDNWHITGCPVNGPQADAIGSTVSVAWFTAAVEPLVKLSTSFDSGLTFSAPITLNQALPLGRVEVVQLTEQRAIAIWIESRDDTTANIQAQLVDHGKVASQVVTVSTVKTSRRSGFPRAARIDDATVLIAWTEFSLDTPTIATASIAVTNNQNLTTRSAN